jgi:Uma2 family endonuclease
MHDRLVAEPIKLTYEDYCALPDDGRRYEILDGDLYMSPSPEEPHQNVVLNLGAILRDHVRRHGLGKVYIAPFDVVLDENDVVEPDVIFVSKVRRPKLVMGRIRGAPDLLVEVISPSSVERDRRDKRNLYARCGVNWYWIIDPDKQSVLELRLVENGYAVVSETSDPGPFTPQLFPGLQIPLLELWE